MNDPSSGAQRGNVWELDSKASDQLIERHWPAIQRTCREKIAPAVLDAARNDEAMTQIARLLHAQLPWAVRLVVREERFVAFCLTNRDRLIAAVAPSA
jgi:hypothetical protein